VPGQLGWLVGRDVPPGVLRKGKAMAAPVGNDILPVGRRRRAGLTPLIVMAGLAILGAAACSSAEPTTTVKGEVLSKADGTLGGPSPAVAEFRAGERAVYGN